MFFWEGFKKNYPSSSKNIFSCQTRLELQMGLASMVRWNNKMSFLAANTQDGFGEPRDKKYPMYTIKFTAVFLMMWDNISAGGPVPKGNLMGISAGNLKGLEWFWMKEWSLISCQVLSNLIRHYRRTFRAVKLANRGFKKYWIKGCR